MTDTMTPEQAAEEWCQNKFGHTHTKFSGQTEFTPNPCIEAYLVGYQRGKADAEKLIWDRIMETRIDGPDGITNLRQAIFGGGDESIK